MTSRAEVTTRNAKVHTKASEKDGGRILDEVVEVVRWSRDNARGREAAARWRQAGRENLLAMSAASIDRYLKPAKAADQVRGVSTTKPSPLLRSSIKIRKTGNEVEGEPGFFEGDTVAHCGPTLKGESARTPNLTDVQTGWMVHSHGA